MSQALPKSAFMTPTIPVTGRIEAPRTFPVRYPDDDWSDDQDFPALVQDNRSPLLFAPTQSPSSTDFLSASEPQFTLAELIDQEVRAYQAWGNPAGRLLAMHMAELAERVRFTGATTIEDYEARAGFYEEWAGVGEC